EEQREKDGAHNILAETRIDDAGEQLAIIAQSDELQNRMSGEGLRGIPAPVGQGPVHGAADEVVDENRQEEERREQHNEAKEPALALSPLHVEPPYKRTPRGENFLAGRGVITAGATFRYRPGRRLPGQHSPRHWNPLMRGRCL